MTKRSTKALPALCPRCARWNMPDESLIWQKIKCSHCGFIFILEDKPEDAEKWALHLKKINQNLNGGDEKKMVDRKKRQPIRTSNASFPESYQASDENLRMYQADNNSDKSSNLNFRLLNSLIVVSLTALVLLFIVFGYKKDKSRLLSRIDGLEMEVRTLNWDRKKAISEKNEIKATQENEILEARSVAESYKSGLAAIKRLLIKQGFSDFEAEQFLSVSDKSRNEIINQKTNKQLPTDNRLDNGTVILDNANPQFNNTFVVENNGKKDAFVKLVKNDKAVASFYVRASSRFNYDGVPSGLYDIVFCTGYDWDSTVRDFNPNRYREAAKFDNPAIYTNGKIITVTLASQKGGNASTSKIPLSEFQNY